MSDAFKPLLSILAEGRALDADQARAFLAACLRGEPTPGQVAAALTALRMRGETVEEISAFASASFFSNSARARRCCNDAASSRLL